MARRNPIWPDIALAKRRAGTGRLHNRPRDGKIKAARRAVVGWLE